MEYTFRFIPALARVCLFLSLVAVINCQLPTTYEYFTAGGITSGLTADTRGFFRLNGKELRIVSGAIHYFRVHPDYWRDRLRKLRATGANTVETYVPWNLHEPERGIFDFGGGGRDMSAFLDVRRYVQMAQEEDLLVLFRPGPYICAEWEYGGLPSWLQRDPDMKVRTSYQPYLDRVKIYFDELLPHVADLQFTRGGPIIGLQVENEYASFRPIHKTYLELTKSVYEDNGFGDSLLFTSDGSWNGDAGSLPGLLLTANFQSDAAGNFENILEIQPDRPLMSMEYWAGWFDHWLGRHSTTDPETFAQTLEEIFSPRFNGSVNFYMFHGGTNFGFMAGANSVGNYPYYGSDVTSYDYDAPLSEAGDYTEKYEKIMQLVEQYQVPALHRPDRPAESEKTAYPTVQLQKYLTYLDILARVPASARFTSDQPIYMEQLDMNNNSGQSYGYTLYRKVFNNLGSDTKLRIGPARDFGILLIDGEIQESPAADTGYWLHDEVEFDLQLDGQQSYLIDVLVENSGRVGFGWEEDFLQQKGLTAEGIRVDGVPAEGFHILALEFKSEWIQGLSNWRLVEDALKGPALFQSTFTIGGAPVDTFLDMRTWHKGVVFVNGFNLGRYFRAGPQQTLYVPAPLLRSGENTITIFEQLEPGVEIKFTNAPVLDTPPAQP